MSAESNEPATLAVWFRPEDAEGPTEPWTMTERMKATPLGKRRAPKLPFAVVGERFLPPLPISIHAACISSSAADSILACLRSTDLCAHRLTMR